MADYLPNAELVAVEMFKTGLAPFTGIATTLPEPSEVAGDGFITIDLLGGLPNVETRMKASEIQVDCWGYNENSQRLPWAKTANLGMRVNEFIETNQNFVVQTPNTYRNAYVHIIDVIEDLRRVPDDAYARYSMDLVVYWTIRSA